MTKKFTYIATMRACYLASFLQSALSIFAILFIPLRTLYGLSYTQFSILLGINLVTQISSDILFSKLVEKYGFRIFSIVTPILSSVGLFVFALSPILFKENLFFGFCLGMFILAASSGLQELLLNPILDALPIPKEKKERKMSLLHSSFAWGQIFAVLTTTLFVFFVEAKYWPVLVSIWAVFPLISVWLFSRVPLYEKVNAKQALKLRDLFCNKIFLLLILAIIFGGAAEVVMSQWSSAFIERGLSFPKLIGDMIGVCGFSLMLAIGRTGYGIFGHKFSLHKVMILGAIGAFLLYVLAALSLNPIVGIFSCALTGLFVSMLWPGSIMTAAKQLPLGGASMFAMLSAGGDIGASVGAFVIGRSADLVAGAGITVSSLTPEQTGLRFGLLLAALFPLFCFLINIILRRKLRKEGKI